MDGAVRTLTLTIAWGERMARRGEMGRGRESTTHALRDLENQAQGKCQVILNGYLPKKLRNVIESEAVNGRTRSLRGPQGTGLRFPVPPPEAKSRTSSGTPRCSTGKTSNTSNTPSG
jgi:hypothetical protein